MTNFNAIKTLNLMTQEMMQTIDSIQVSLNAGGMNTINIVLAFVMYGVALGIKPAIFVEVWVCYVSWCCYRPSPAGWPSCSPAGFPP